MAARKSIVVIVGPTASGKSALAHQLALKYGAEILSADARTIYKYADIGTAKPSAADRKEITYHGLDLRELNQHFSAYDFQQYANRLIKLHRTNRTLLIIVGGTGLYIDSVLYDFSFRSVADPQLRERLSDTSVQELQDLVLQQGLELPRNNKNPRHLIRVLETGGQSAQKNKKLPRDTVVIGLLPPDIVLKERISERVEHMYEIGFATEVKKLLRMYAEADVVKAGIGYRSALDYLSGDSTLTVAKDEFKRGDWQYARRQRMWFKRNKDISWFSDSNKAMVHIEHSIKHEQ